MRDGLGTGQALGRADRHWHQGHGIEVGLGCDRFGSGTLGTERTASLQALHLAALWRARCALVVPGAGWWVHVSPWMTLCDVRVVAPRLPSARAEEVARWNKPHAT
jgi:hypothetical protein